MPVQRCWWFVTCLAAAPLTLAAATSVPAEPARNLISNPHFETWEVDTGPPPAWSFLVGQSSAVVHKDSVVKHSGVASVRVDLKTPNNTGWIGQTVAGIHPDTDYRLSGFIRAAPGAKLQMPMIVEPNLSGCDLASKEEWTEWECPFNSREATEIVVQFRFRGEGSVWLDDIQLVQIGEAGASVLPERRQILKLLDYQSHPVTSETNTDEWTKPYTRRQDPGRTFPSSEKPGLPSWKVGQWTRYLCQDELLVPSRKPEKRPCIVLIDCAIVGQEKVDGKNYWWYQSVVRLDKYWVAQAQGRYDSGKKILLATPRKVVLSLLVEGPKFRDIRRYQLKVDGEPLVEYTDGQRAVLPTLNMDLAFIKPAASLRDNGDVWVSGTYHQAVPTTGIRSFEYHASHLDRKAQIVNWGDTGATDERNNEKPLMLKLARPPYVAVAFDGFGEVQHYKEMLAAGAEWFQHQTVLYLGEARVFFNQMPAYISNVTAWDVDMFDVCRSNFAGFAAHLDEPYQRQRKPNEYIKRGDVSNLHEAGAKYSEAVQKLVKQYCWWPGQTVPDYNSPASAAWYSARAGAAGFVLEQARLLSDLETIKRVTGKEDARALSDELNIACMAGAAKQFGGWWGEGIYRWVPERYWKDSLVYFAERGARYLGFWIDGGENLKDAKLTFYSNVLRCLPEIAKAIKSTHPQPRNPTVVLLVPDGYVIGLSGSSPETPWGILDFPQGTSITEEVIAKGADLFDRGVTFDIATNDPDHRLALGGYEQVIRVGG